MKKIKIADAQEIGEGTAQVFRIIRGGRYQSGFLVRHQGELYAYENKCRHIPVSLDYGDARFFDAAKQFLVCQTHGAVYQPDTGLCVDGPCQGATLFPIEIEMRGSEVYAESETEPDPEPSE